MTLGMIWAQAHGRVIGHEADMPWHLPEDLRHFRRTTGSDPVVMGRTSWDALPEKARPLPGRHNIVLSSQPDFAPEGATVARELDEALRLAGPGRVWICGGAKVYAEAIDRADVLVVTDIDLDVQGDRYAPEIGSAWQLSSTDPAEGWHVAAGGLRYRVSTYTRH